MDPMSLSSGGGMSLKGGAGGAATGGTTTTTTNNNSGFDSSNWTIATSGSKATGGGMNPWLIAGGVALAALWILKRK